MLAVSLPLAVGGLGSGGMQVRWPSLASVGSSAVRLLDWVSGHHAPAPRTPVQQAGTAAGRPHAVPAAVTRAVAHATGHQPGKGRGQRPAYAPDRPAERKFTTGPAGHGFDPRASKLVASSMTAKSDLYKNPGPSPCPGTEIV